MPQNKALIVAHTDESADLLSRMAISAGIKDITVTDGSNIREKIPAEDYSVIVFSLPLADSFGNDLVNYVGRCSKAVQVVFVPSKVYDEVCGKLSGIDAVVIPKTAANTVGPNTIRYAAAQRERMDQLRSENESLRKMVNDNKLVNRAKCVLIEYLRITEKDAHKHLQKRAMDQRMTLSEAAEEIIKVYEIR